MLAATAEGAPVGQQIKIDHFGYRPAADGLSEQALPPQLEIDDDWL